MVSTLVGKQSCFHTCGVGKDYRKAEVCLAVDWRLGASAKQFGHQAPGMLVRTATWLKMLLDELWTGHMASR